MIIRIVIISLRLTVILKKKAHDIRMPKDSPYITKIN